MIARRPVVLTGASIVHPAAVGVPALRDRLASGTTAPRSAPRCRPGLVVPGPAAVFEPEFEAERWVDPRAVRKVSILSRHAVAAARLALDDARFGDDLPRDEGSVCLGSAFGSAGYHLEYHEALHRTGGRGGSALLFSECVFNSACGHVSRALGLRGANHALVGGEDVGLAAIALGADRVASGATPLVVAGGAEEHSDLIHASLRAEGLLDPADPFAEGAAFVVVEDEEAARRRGASIRARILGSGRGDPASAMRRAAAEAGREPEFTIGVVPRAVLGEGFAATSAALALLGAFALEGGVRTVLLVSATAAGGATALVLGHAG